jgi:hypothetical protein
MQLRTIRATEMIDLNQWPSEHKTALKLAVGTGAFIGLILGNHYVPPIWNSHQCDNLLAKVLHVVCGSDYLAWSPLIEGPLLGAFLAAVVIYIWKLMKA